MHTRSTLSVFALFYCHGISIYRKIAVLIHLTCYGSRGLPLKKHNFLVAFFFNQSFSAWRPTPRPNDRTGVKYTHDLVMIFPCSFVCENGARICCFIISWCKAIELWNFSYLLTPSIKYVSSVYSSVWNLFQKEYLLKKKFSSANIFIYNSISNYTWKSMVSICVADFFALSE